MGRMGDGHNRDEGTVILRPSTPDPSHDLMEVLTMSTRATSTEDLGFLGSKKA